MSLVVSQSWAVKIVYVSKPGQQPHTAALPDKVLLMFFVRQSRGENECIRSED